MLHPVRKWIATGLAKGADEVTDVPAPFIDGFDEPRQTVGIMVVLFRRNPLSAVMRYGFTAQDASPKSVVFFLKIENLEKDCRQKT
jgi:hypothetical protein